MSLLHTAESDYGHGGPYAWLMDVNVLIRGELSLAAAIEIDRALAPRGAYWLGSLLPAGWGLLSGLLALFPDDLGGGL